MMDHWLQHFGECREPQNGGNEISDSLASSIEAHAFSVQSLAGLQSAQHMQPLRAGQPSSSSWTQAELAPPFQTMTRNGGYSRAMGQGHLTAGSGIWNTCLCGAIWS